MAPRDVNLLNIGLMALSAAVAWERPAELFFFAYGVLGPLHYLTEISWLEKRNWFSTSRRDWAWPVLVALLSTGLYAWTLQRGPKAPPLAIGDHPALGGGGFFLSAFDALTWSVVATTVAAAFVSRRSWKIATTLLVGAAGVAILQLDGVRVLTGVFLPTLVHVFLFTSCFILYGALKSRSASGHVSFFVHMGLGAFLLFSPDGGSGVLLPRPGPGGETLDEKLGAFKLVIGETSRLLGYPTTGSGAREGLLNAFRFMAYAYTYHYLNWFSKTGIIRWHEASKRRLIAIVVVWIASAALYAYDWKIGFTALLGLSLAHVFLEFPLNWRTFVGIGDELKKRATRQADAAAR